MEGRRPLLTSVVLFLSFAIVAFAASAPAAAASSQERKEYVPSAEKKELLREDLIAIPGKEAHISRLQLPPGWVGKRHFHTGDVFVYVVKGVFAVDGEGRGRLTFRTGEVYHEAVNTVMQARNLSTTEPTEILLFQVSNKGEPLMILAPPHPDNN